MGRRLAICLGVLVAALVGSVGVYVILNWRDVAIAYHARRLERDPDYLSQILESPDGSPARDAVSRYLDEPEGAAHLLRLYAAELARNAKRPLRSTDRLALTYDPETLGPGRDAMAIWDSPRSAIRPVDAPYLRLLDRLAQERAIPHYEAFEVDGREGLRFRIARARMAAPLVGMEGRLLLVREEGRLVCVVEGKDAPDLPPPKPDSVELLLQVLASPLPGETELARELLARLGCDPDDPVPYLLRRERGMLGALRFVDGKHVPRLADALDDGDRAVRFAVLKAIIAKRPAPETAIPIYVAATRDEDVEMRDQAVNGLATVGPAALPAMLGLLESGPERMHFRLLNEIGRFGVAAESAVPALEAWMNAHPNPHMREKVAEILPRISSVSGGD